MGETITRAMQKRNLKKWIKALRSGKYKQTREKLCDDKRESFCCLGVLCDVLKLPYTVNYDGQRAYYYSCSMLPIVAVAMVGLSTSEGDFGSSSLINLNDKSKYSFKKIADVLEKGRKGLFVWSK
jgi:hypothetical protein